MTERPRSDARPRIVLTSAVHKRFVERLTEHGDVVVVASTGEPSRASLVAACAGATALLVVGGEAIDEAVLAAAGPQLRVIANIAVGYDNVDVDAASARGVVVTNTPGVLTDDTADMAMALILATARRVVEGDRLIRRREPWRPAPGFMLGRSVSGAELGIVGFGRIGQAVARRARGFGMRVRYTSRSAAPAATEMELDVTRCSLEQILEGADFVSLHCPLTEETRHLIGAAQLAQMKPSGILINTARGPVVDERALAEALRDGVIAGAGLDVFEHEPAVDTRLLACESAVLVPHLGSATAGTRIAMAELAIDNILSVLVGKDPLTPVG